MTQTPLSQIKNFGPTTRAEFEVLGIHHFEQVINLGFEDTCRRWVERFPERLNANAFLGIICAIEGTVWTKATSSQRQIAHDLVATMRAELGLPQTRRNRKRR